jgi:Flp pilus assembly protein TadG
MLTTAKARTWPSQKGATMVETALVLLILIMMIVFILDMGRVLLLQQYMTERARATIRQAVVNNWTSDQVKNYFAYNQLTAPDGGTSTPGILGMLPMEVTYLTPTTGAPSCCVKLTISGVNALLFTPKLAGTMALPPITLTLPTQSMGATN